MQLYNKYRPKNLKQIVGNKELVSSLNNLLESEELPHSILLTGPHGCGKTTIGRIIAKEVGSKGLDYKELDTGVYRGIDTVRDLRKQTLTRPLQSKNKVYLIDEVHMLGRGGDSSKNEAQQAFLKVLEDTPNHVYFILCTTNPEMLNKTIKSRCVEFKVEKLTDLQITSLIKRICKKEKKKINPKVVSKIYESSNGHVRDAIQILQKVLYEKNVKTQLKLAVPDETEEQAQVNKLCQALLKREDWGKVRKMLQSMKSLDPETIRRQILGYANAVLLNGGEDASMILGWFLDKPTYDSGFPLITQYCYNIIKEIEPPC